jgi:hypothetical protein
LRSNTGAVVIKSPKKVEEYVHKQEKENSLLQGRGEICTVQFPLKEKFEKPACSENHYQDKKGIEKISYTEWNPPKQETLKPGNQWINAITVIPLDPSGVQGNPFYEDSGDYK